MNGSAGTFLKRIASGCGVGLLGWALLISGQALSYETCKTITKSSKRNRCIGTLNQLNKTQECAEGDSQCSTLKFYFIELNGIVSSDFTQYPFIKSIDIIGNNLSLVPEDFFQKFPNVESIKLTWNKNIRDIPCGAFQNLKNLNFLEIYHLNLERLCRDQFAGLSSLHYLDMSHNNLDSIPANVFDDLVDLKELEMDSNFESDSGPIETLPPGLFDHNLKLTSLDLDGNGIKTLPANIFDNLQKLIKLDLIQNSFTYLPEDIFDKLPRKMKIYVDPTSNVLTDLLAGDSRMNYCNT